MNAQLQTAGQDAPPTGGAVREEPSVSPKSRSNRDMTGDAPPTRGIERATTNKRGMSQNGKPNDPI